MPQLQYHDDDCDAFLDRNGECPRCRFVPDTQSTGFMELSVEELNRRLQAGETFRGRFQTPIERHPEEDGERIDSLEDFKKKTESRIRAEIDKKIIARASHLISNKEK